MPDHKKLKTALIFGVTGQDGAYLSHLLFKKGYRIIGTTRGTIFSNHHRLKLLGIYDKITIITVNPIEYEKVRDLVLSTNPDEIYYLAGQSSVGYSFEQPFETIDSIIRGVLNVLEVMKLTNKKIRFFHASSSECFGNTDGKQADENTPFKPMSPYAVAKASAHWLVVNYRESYNLFACNGILFNHESPLRSDRFVTQKIIQAVSLIKHGKLDKLKLGRLDIYRDWGWAQEYVEAMWLMLQLKDPIDLVISTGEANKLEDFVAEAFSIKGLDWREWVEVSPDLYRPNEILYSCGNPRKAENTIGWRARFKMRDIVYLLSNNILFAY